VDGDETTRPTRVVIGDYIEHIWRHSPAHAEFWKIVEIRQGINQTIAFYVVSDASMQ
jgi:hypothetical protein